MLGFWQLVALVSVEKNDAKQRRIMTQKREKQEKNIRKCCKYRRLTQVTFGCQGQ